MADTDTSAPVYAEAGPDVPTSADLDGVTYAQISKLHPEYQRWQPKLEDYALLYRGGEEFLAAAGQSSRSRVGRGIDGVLAGVASDIAGMRGKRRRFLWQLEGEPDTSYYGRWERAVYIPYLGAILDYFRHYLFSTPPRMRCAEAENEPDWWDAFREDCDGSGANFLDFARDSFLQVLIGRKAGWLIGGTGSVASAADDRVVLTPYDASQILDWDCDEAGDLKWIVLRRTCLRRNFPAERLMYETYTYADRYQWRTWELEPLPAGGHESPDRKLVPIAGGEHNLGVVPFVLTEIPYGLWATNKLASWQVDIFNQMSMLSDAELKAGFLQPFFKGHDIENAAQVLGNGVMMFLRCGVNGMEAEDFGWKAPEMAPLEHLLTSLEKKRDEGYRVVHQMSLAVDSNAVSAIARSGASKIEDRRATEIILCAYGGYVRESLLKTLKLISQIYGDNSDWTVDGFDNFEVSDFADEVNTAGLVLSMMSQGGKAISKTAWAEIWKDILGGRVLNHVDEKTRGVIRDEVEEAAEEQGEMPSLLDQMQGQQMVMDEQAKDAANQPSLAGAKPSGDEVEIGR